MAENNLNILQRLASLGAGSGVVVWNEWMQQYSQIRRKISADEALEIDQALIEKLEPMMRDWQSQLECCGSVSSRPHLIDAMRQVRDILAGTQMAHTAQAALHRCQRAEIDECLSDPPSWVGELREGFRAIHAVPNGKLPGLLSVLEAQAKKREDSWVGMLADELTVRVANLLSRVNVKKLGAAQQESLIGLGRLLQSSRVLGPGYEQQLLPHFAELSYQFDELRRRRSFRSLQGQITQALDGKDLGRAGKLITEARELAQGDNEDRQVEERSGALQRLANADDAAQAALEKMSWLLQPKDWQHLSRWAMELLLLAQSMVAQTSVLRPVRSTALSSELSRFFSFCDDIPLPSDLLTKAAIKEVEGLVHSRQLIGKQMAQVLDGYQACSQASFELANLTTRIEQQEDFPPDWGKRLAQAKTMALKGRELWTQLARNLVWRRVELIFEKGASTEELNAFNYELKALYAQHAWLTDTKARENLEDIAILQHEIDTFDQWTAHQGLPQLQDMPPELSSSVMVADTLSKRDKILGLSLSLVKAEEAFEAKQWHRCGSLLQTIASETNWQKNRRYLDLQRQMQSMGLIDRFRRLLDENKFQMAQELLTENGGTGLQNQYHLQEELAAILAGHRRYQDLQKNKEKNLGQRELWCAELQSLLDDSNSKTGLRLSRLDQRLLNDQLMAGLNLVHVEMSRLLREINPRLSMIWESPQSVGQALHKLDGIEARLELIAKSFTDNPLFYELRTEALSRRTALELIRALIQEDYAGARDLLEHNSSMEIRSMWSHRIDFVEAWFSFKRDLDPSGLRQVITQPWYGSYGCKLQPEQVVPFVLVLFERGEVESGLLQLLNHENLSLLKHAVQFYLNPSASTLHALSKGFNSHPRAQADVQTAKALFLAPRTPMWAMALKQLGQMLPQSLMQSAQLEDALDQVYREAKEARQWPARIMGEIEKTLEEKQDPGLAHLGMEADQVLAFLDAGESLGAESLMVSPGASKKQVLEMKRDLEELASIRQRFSQAKLEFWWFVKPQRIIELKKGLQGFDPKYAILRPLFQKLAEWGQLVGSATESWENLRAQLVKGDFGSALASWQLWEKLTSGAGDIRRQKIAEFLKGPQFKLWRQAGGEPELSHDLKPILSDLKNNLSQVSDYVDRFWALIRQRGLQHDLLSNQSRNVDRFHDLGRNQEANRERQALETRFFDPELKGLMEQWKDVGSPLSSQAEQKLRTLTTSPQWRSIREGYMALNDPEAGGNR